MHPSRLTFHTALNPYKAFRITAYTPLFWVMAIGLLLPYYGSLPLGLPGRPVLQSVEEQLQESLPLRCHMQALSGDREQFPNA